MGMAYQWANGRSFAVSAQVVGEELDRLKRKAGGSLSPDEVVEAARPKKAPLHPVFTWDNTEAAEQWRRHQARHLVASVRVVHETQDGPRNVQAFVSVITEDDGRRYVDTETAMRDDDMRDAVLAEALQQLEAWQRRYSHLEELQPIFEALEAAKEPV